MIGTILNQMTDAEEKAWKALAGYKYWMAGYHMARWVNYRRLLVDGGHAQARGFKNPFGQLVVEAKAQLKIKELSKRSKAP